MWQAVSQTLALSSVLVMRFEFDANTVSSPLHLLIALWGLRLYINYK